MWFILSVITILSWGLADLYYKKGTDENDKYSHLKIGIWVGIVMGICSVALLIYKKDFTFVNTVKNAIMYSPASISYIVSMIIGYKGLRYLEVSIISPVQNASGALSAVCLLFFFIFTGRISSVFDELSVIDILGSILIIAGVIFLAVVEQKGLIENNQTDKKYRYGAAALVFPILYCVFDTIGTSADGIILDKSIETNLDEISVLILYGLTFFLFAVVSWIFVSVKSKIAYNPFKKSESDKIKASVFEEIGEVFYVYAMASKSVLAAPMVASYCIVSVILGRVILKEKLSKMQYLCIFSVIAGIVLLGISEGME